MTEKLQLLSGNKVYTDVAIDSMFKTEPNFFIVNNLPDADDPRVQPNAIYYKKVQLDPEQLNTHCFIRGTDEHGQYIWHKDDFFVVDELPEDLSLVNETSVYQLSDDNTTAYRCDTDEHDVKQWFTMPLVILTRLPDAQDPSILDDTVYKVAVTDSTPTLVAYVLGTDAQGNKCWLTDGDSKSNVERNYNNITNRPQINGETFWGNMDKDKATAATSVDGLSGGYNLSIPEADVRSIVQSVFGA